MPILNVDDHPASRFLRSRMLEQAGFTVREAGSGQEALTACQSEPPPELILLDVALPDMDGFSVCEALKAQHPTLPIVMLTSVYQSSQNRRDGFQVGADAYLLDPVEPNRLVHVIKQFLAPDRDASRIVPPTIITDEAGYVVSANAAAARLLNLSTRGLRDRSFLAFFDGGRDRLDALRRQARAGGIADAITGLRPRDRKPFTARIEVSAADFERGGSLEWTIEPLQP